MVIDRAPVSLGFPLPFMGRGVVVKVEHGGGAFKLDLREDDRSEVFVGSDLGGPDAVEGSVRNHRLVAGCLRSKNSQATNY